MNPFTYVQMLDNLGIDNDGMLPASAQCAENCRRWGRAARAQIAIEETYDVSANVFSPVDQRKKAPPVIALEPRTLELVRRHRRYLTRRNHSGIKTGLLFPSEAETRPVGNTYSTTSGERCRCWPGSIAR